MCARVFETGIKGLDVLLGGGIRWGSLVSIVSDLYDRVTLLHQIVANALSRGFIVYYLCVKEAPEQVRLLMKELNLNANHYENKRLLRFYTPFETALTEELKDSAGSIKIMSKFTKRMMRDVSLQILKGKKVLIVINNASALYDLLHDDPRWKDFLTRGLSWVRKLINVIGIDVGNSEDLEAAESIHDFCILLKNIDGIPYIKQTKMSIAGWVPYTTAQNQIEIAQEFIWG